MEKGLYTKTLTKQKIDTHTLPQEQQKKLNEIIQDILRNERINDGKKNMKKILQYFAEKNILNIVLACTDLQLLSPAYPGIQIHDSMEIFAQATAKTILGK